MMSPVGLRSPLLNPKAEFFLAVTIFGAFLFVCFFVFNWI